MISRQAAGLHISAAHFPPLPTVKQIMAFTQANEEIFEEFKVSPNYVKVILESRLRLLRQFRGIQSTDDPSDTVEFDPKISDSLLQIGRTIHGKDVFSVCLDDLRVDGTGDYRVLVIPRNNGVICDIMAFQVFRINEFGSIMFLPNEVEDVFDEIADLRTAQKGISPEDAVKFDVPPVCTQRTMVFVKFTEEKYTAPAKSAFDRLW